MGNEDRHQRGDGDRKAAVERPAPRGEDTHEDQADGFVAAEPGEPDLGPTEAEADPAATKPPR